MSFSDVDYERPAELIAQTPVEPRSAARLLIDEGDRPARHSVVKHLGEELRAGDVLVVNNTKVLPRVCIYNEQQEGRSKSYCLSRWVMATGNVSCGRGQIEGWRRTVFSYR